VIPARPDRVAHMQPGIADWIPAWAEVQPDRPVLIYEGETTTWGEFDLRVRALATGLRARGVKPGDRVACLMHNRPEFLELFWATVRLGAIFAPLNVRLAIPELRWIVDNLEPAVVATDNDFDDTVRQLDVPLWITPDEDLPVPCETFASLRAVEDDGAPQPLPGFDDPAMILFTSGTTGRPKGAVISHGNIHYQAANWMACFGTTRRDRGLLFLPLCFTGGLLSASMNPFLAGGSIVVTKGFDPPALLKVIERDRPTWFTAVPTMVQRLFEHPDARTTDLSSLTMVESGGAPVSVPLIEHMRSLGKELIQGYGLTEGSGGCNLYLQEFEGVRKAGSCGKRVPLGDAKVIREDGSEAATGEIGELLISGPLVFQGYWRNPEATASTIVDGWLHTGDLATRDDEGFYTMAGRKKEMVITGGLNVYPIEVEQVIQGYPSVAEAAVVGLPDDRWGEAVTAFVRVRPGHDFDAEALLTRCREQIADYKVPKQVIVVDDFPRTASDKPLKRELIARYLAVEA
jgi:fatty-acyl-CoA synthase